MRPGCYDPMARLDDMDRAGILASLCFPTITRFCGQLFMEASDREFGFVCLQAYNDWMIDEWCGAAPGRYIPLILIPMWDPQLAAKEMERCAAKGATTFALLREPRAARPAHDPRPGPLLGPGDGRGQRPRDGRVDARRLVVAGAADLRPTRRSSPTSPGARSRTSGTMLSWLFSGMFQRFPNLKIALSEGEIGWIPYFLERAEQVLDKQRHWVKQGMTFLGHAAPTRTRPRHTSTSAARSATTSTAASSRTRHGIRSLDEIGEDNVMCETDYPHSDSTWPDCIERRRNTHRTSARDASTRSCAATPSGSTGSPRPSRPRCLTQRSRRSEPAWAAACALCTGKIAPIVDRRAGPPGVGPTGRRAADASREERAHAGVGLARPTSTRRDEGAKDDVVASTDRRAGAGRGAAHRRRRATCPTRSEVAGDDRGRGRAVRPARHPLQQRRHPDAAARDDLRGPHASTTSTGSSRSTSAACSSAASTRCCSSRSRVTAA